MLVVLIEQDPLRSRGRKDGGSRKNRRMFDCYDRAGQERTEGSVPDDLLLELDFVTLSLPPNDRGNHYIP